jgi:hypothetical protein
MACLVVGISLGIVTGTLIADGSFERAYTAAFHPAVQAGVTVVAAARTQEAKPTPAPIAEVKSPSAAVMSPAPESKGPSVQAKNPVLEAKSQVAQAKGPAQAVADPAHEVRTSMAKVPAILAVADSGRAAASIEHRARLRPAAHHRRHGHRRHRLRASLNPAGKGVAPLADPPKAQTANRNYAFSVEGNATVVNYDASAGKLETYEGETFELARSSADPGTDGWLGYPSDVQYRCDQAWNCTLFRTGGLTLSAHRTR